MVPDGFWSLLADCPAMSLVLSVDIAGSGDPLYVAELCNWHYYGQRRSIRLILFAKRAFHIQIVSEEANNPLKNGQEKGGFFSGLSAIGS